MTTFEIFSFTDVDECATNNGECDQKCSNLIGGYECSCYAGYRQSITNQKRCDGRFEAGLELIH